jgi:hypothetical protein
MGTNVKNSRHDVNISLQLSAREVAPVFNADGSLPVTPFFAAVMVVRLRSASFAWCEQRNGGLSVSERN